MAPAALMAAAGGVPSQEQPPATQASATQPAEGDVEFTLFLNGTRVGVERVRLARNGSNWVLSSTAQFGAPLNTTVNRFEVKYTPDWQPTELHIEATQGGRPMSLSTSFGVTTAINEITQNGTKSSKTDQVSARTIVLPNTFIAGYEALAARLASSQPGAELKVYVVPQAEVTVSVKNVSAEQLPSPAGMIAGRKYDVVFQNPGRPLDVAREGDGLHPSALR